MTEPSQRMGTGMLFLACVLAFALLVLFFANIEERHHQPENPNQNPQSRVLAGGVRQVVLQANAMHHYLASGEINGYPVTFIIDTGASDVSIPDAVARRIGLRGQGYAQARTAAGITRVALTRIHTLKIGDIVLHDLRASILPSMHGNEILLGMNALKQISFVHRGGKMILRQQFSKEVPHPLEGG